MAIAAANCAPLSFKPNQEKYYTSEKLIGFLKQAAAGAPAKELCRRYGISEASYFT